MSLEHYSILEAVEVAVAVEEEGAKFYSLAAERVSEPGMRELFEDLREKEFEHMRIFRHLYSEMASRRGDADADMYLLDPEIAATFKAYAETAVFPTAGAAEEAIAGVSGAGDILRLGVRAEKDSILFYREVMKHSPYPEAKELVGRIIAEEEKHLIFLARKLKENA